jgi:hypothetical protein
MRTWNRADLGRMAGGLADLGQRTRRSCPEGRGPVRSGPEDLDEVARRAEVQVDLCMRAWNRRGLVRMAGGLGDLGQRTWKSCPEGRDPDRAEPDGQEPGRHGTEGRKKQP